jgi:hypothetical protein
MEDNRGAYRVLVESCEGKRPLGILKWGLQEVGWGGMDWIDLAHDGDRRRALVDWVMNFRVSEKTWNFLAS